LAKKNPILDELGFIYFLNSTSSIIEGQLWRTYRQVSWLTDWPTHQTFPPLFIKSSGLFWLS